MKPPTQAQIDKTAFYLKYRTRKQRIPADVIYVIRYFHQNNDGDSDVVTQTRAWLNSKYGPNAFPITPALLKELVNPEVRAKKCQDKKEKDALKRSAEAESVNDYLSPVPDHFTPPAVLPPAAPEDFLDSLYPTGPPPLTAREVRKMVAEEVQYVLEAELEAYVRTIVEQLLGGGPSTPPAPCGK